MDLRRLKEQAAQLVAEGRYERAEVVYRQLLTVAPRDHALWLKHAELLKRLARVAPAVASYRMAAQLLMEYGHANRAIAAVKIALTLQPDDVELVSDIIRYELRQRQRSREMPAVVAAELTKQVTPAELHAEDGVPAPAPLLALPMLSTSESRITAMVDSVAGESALKTRWPQVRKVSDTEVAIKPSPFMQWIVVTSHTAMQVKFDDDYAVPEAAAWLGDSGS